MNETRRDVAERMVPQLGSNVVFRLQQGDGDLREALVQRVMRNPSEGLAFAIRDLLRDGILHIESAEERQG